MFKLTTDHFDSKPVMQWDDVRTSLHKLSSDGDSFAVLSNSSGKFVQTAASAEGFSIERQDGDVGRHFVGTHNGNDLVPLTVVEGVFRAFYEARPLPAEVHWQTMVIKPASPAVLILAKVVPWVIGAYFMYLAFQIWRGSIDLWEWLK